MARLLSAKARNRPSLLTQFFLGPRAFGEDVTQLLLGLLSIGKILDDAEDAWFGIHVERDRGGFDREQLSRASLQGELDVSDFTLGDQPLTESGALVLTSLSSSGMVLTVPSTYSLRAPAPSSEAGVLAQAATAP